MNERKETGARIRNSIDERKRINDRMKDWRIKKWKNDKDESLKDDEKWNNKKALKHERKRVKERMKIWNFENRKRWKDEWMKGRMTK